MNPRNTLRFFKSVLMGLALTVPASLSYGASDFILNTFDSASELTNVNNEWSGGSATWDGTQDAGGDAGTGSLHVVVPYTSQGNNWQETQVGRNIPWPYIDLTAYVYVEMDIKPDVANSFPAIDGNWCETQPIIQQWAWTPLTNVRILSNGWTHIKVSLNPATTLAHLVVDFHRTYNAYPTNTIAYWIDNVKLTVPPAPPPTLALKPPSPPGLLCIASQPPPNSTYQRQIMRTTAGASSWNSATASSNTVTYSMTIASFPGTAYSGFIAQMFLVPQYFYGDISRTNMQYGPSDSSIDWNSGNVIYWTIGQNANGKAYSDFRIKTNEFGGQTMAFNELPGGPYGTNGFSAGHLAAMVTTVGPLGTWRLAFTDNTNASITAPDGSVTNFVLDADAAAIYQDPLYAYFGIQPNGTNATDYSRIGQAATLSHIQIDTSAQPIDDNFSSGTLDTLTWTRCAADNTGLWVVPTDAAYFLSWTTPDPGFTNIWCTSNIAASITNGGWANLTGVPLSSWHIILDRRNAIITWSALDAALSGSETSQTFFRLWKVTGP